ncbi:MAG: tetraacyldisaccharide 4'-kinase, partial [Gemmatimonadetes bacterium]|nr:tetraacyldisaccharide 4'-kinase [Gemmatimonadota bacterium]
MRGKLETFAWRLWRGEAGLSGAFVSVLLFPLEGLWRLVTRVRNRRHDRAVAPRVDGLAIVSVGNLAVGGTGKTPVSAWVVSVLKNSGYRPAVLLSGYGEDEVALHRAWNPDVAVFAAADRGEAAKAARAEGCDVAVVDDGFQHRRLGRLLDVVLLSAADPLPGAVLPRGPYREPLSALRRAGVVVVTRRRHELAVAKSRLEALRGRGVLSDGVTTAGARLAPEAAVPLG